MDVSGRGEFAAIARIASGLPSPPPGELWIGDDAAVLAGRRGPLLFAADTVVVGVHADLGLVGLDDLGWKAVSVNVSDIAAMGGTPVAALVTVAGPPDTDLDLLYEGIAAAAERWSCPVVGGDLTTAGQLVVTVAVLGETGGTPVTRRGARAGDTIMVTGPLGASAAGLRLLRAGSTAGPLVGAHRRPEARVAEGQAARLAGATAMIDVSDGLVGDLGHLLDSSGVGCRLDTVPIADGATNEEALGGGEDYELVFTTADSAEALAVFAREGLRPPLTIGRCVADRAERTLEGGPMTDAGWEHPWG